MAGGIVNVAVEILKNNFALQLYLATGELFVRFESSELNKFPVVASN